MLNIYQQIGQKIEAQSKIDHSTDNGKSYISGSLGIANPIAALNYLKSNTRIEELVQEGHEVNKQRKEDVCTC